VVCAASDARSGAESSSSPAKRQRRPLKRARVTQDMGPCGEPEVQSSSDEIEWFKATFSISPRVMPISISSLSVKLHN
jgi:hypothetical protein